MLPSAHTRKPALQGPPARASCVPNATIGTCTVLHVYMCVCTIYTKLRLRDEPECVRARNITLYSPAGATSLNVYVHATSHCIAPLARRTCTRYTHTYMLHTCTTAQIHHDAPLWRGKHTCIHEHTACT